MNDAIEFTVYGTPAPAGSKRAFALKRRDGSPVLRANGSQVVTVVDANAKSRDWKNAVASAAREAYRGELLRGPLMVRFIFYRPRPAGHLGKDGLNKKGRETPWPISRPDCLKLARAVEDALTSVVWLDDSQIACEILVKTWGEPARVRIMVHELKNDAIDDDTASDIVDAILTTVTQ